MEISGFELEADEEYDKFCGKVFLTTKKNYVFHCMLCESKYLGFDSYMIHVTNQHLNDPFEDEYEEESDDDEPLEESEIPIDALQKVTSIDIVEQKNQKKSEKYVKSGKKESTENCVNVQIDVIEVPIPADIEMEDRSRRIQLTPSVNGLFACPHCPQRFQLEFALRAHVKEHDSDRKFKCTICGMQIKSNALLRSHLRRHEKHKPHQCTECDRSFVTQSELNYHKRNHTGEKPYQCESCGVRFTYRSTLRMHTKRQHTFQKDYVCPLCSKAFYSSRFLRDHMAKHTNEPNYKCEKCGKTFNTSGCFGRHKRIHRMREEAEKNLSSLPSDKINENELN